MKHSADEDTATETDLDTPIPYSIASRDNRPPQDITEDLCEARYLLVSYFQDSRLQDSRLVKALTILDKIILE